MNWVTSGVMKQTLLAKLAKVLYSKYLQKWMENIHYGQQQLGV